LVSSEASIAGRSASICYILPAGSRYIKITEQFDDCSRSQRRAPKWQLDKRTLIMWLIHCTKLVKGGRGCRDMMLLSLDDFSLLFGIVKQETRCAGSSLIWIYSSALAHDMPCRIQTKPDGASRRTKEQIVRNVISSGWISGSVFRSETRPERGRLSCMTVGPLSRSAIIKGEARRGTETNVRRAHSAPTNPNT
jgi:hypothetical protein